MSLSRQDFAYTACYCEENVYRLCQKLGSSEYKQVYVVVASNPEKLVPIWYQRSGCPVYWDYHVLAVVQDQNSNKFEVLDLDTTLDFPENFDEYVRRALPECDMARNYRVIPASAFLQHFASDRSHMLQNGKWNAPPPPEPCIRTSESTMNLAIYLDMLNNTNSEIYGNVLAEKEFRSFFRSPKS